MVALEDCPVSAMNIAAVNRVIMGTRSGDLDPGVLVYLMGGVDKLVFTGGIDENDAQVRHEICSGVAWIGISLDESRKRAASNPVSDGASRCQVFVLASQVDEQIARHVGALLA